MQHVSFESQLWDISWVCVFWQDMTFLKTCPRCVLIGIYAYAMSRHVPSAKYFCLFLSFFPVNTIVHIFIFKTWLRKVVKQWRSQYRGKGGRQRKICQKTPGKNRKIRRKSGGGGKEKSGRKDQNREDSFTLPLLTERAGYATVANSKTPLL